MFSIILGILLTFFAKDCSTKTIGLGVNFGITYSDLQCFLSYEKADFLEVKGYSDHGTLEESAYSNLKVAERMGMPAELYMGTCRSRGAL